jgi:hypothetical protein
VLARASNSLPDRLSIGRNMTLTLKVVSHKTRVRLGCGTVVSRQESEHGSWRISIVRSRCLTTFPGDHERLRLRLYFFIWILEGGVHTGSTRHCGHSWPIVPAPGDCEDGEVGGINDFGRGNRSTHRKPAPMPLFPPQISLARLGHEPRPPLWKASD